MKPENIEAFVDRLCGIFPKDNIARNTVKRAWTQDDVLLDCTVEDGRTALRKLESDSGFPSLARVKDVLRSLKPATMRVNCKMCYGTGWDSGHRMGIGADGKPYVRSDGYTFEWDGRTYRASKRCSCMETRTDEANVGVSNLF